MTKPIYFRKLIIISALRYNQRVACVRAHFDEGVIDVYDVADFNNRHQSGTVLNNETHKISQDACPMSFLYFWR